MGTSVCVALLRGVNVAGKAMVSMADLRAMCKAIGLGEAKTLMQSGNLVVEAGRRAPGAMEQLLEKEAAARLGRPIDFMVRTADEWASIIAANPFKKEAKSEPGKLLVMFLKRAADASAVGKLKALNDGPERFVVAKREIYVVFPEGVGRSRFGAVLMKGKVTPPGTGRNWNTVLKLAAMVSPGAKD